MNLHVHCSLPALCAFAKRTELHMHTHRSGPCITQLVLKDDILASLNRLIEVSSAATTVLPLPEDTGF